MFIVIQNHLLSIYKRIVSSIAFYPFLILMGYFLLAAVLLTQKKSLATSWLVDHAPFLVMDNAATARSILSTMISGNISLMVFSFTMVMMILNQAGSSFSPRLLPGLISDKRNQVVLGVYLGTIVFNILVLTSVRQEDDEFTLNILAILIGIISGIFCLILFTYFIHTISNSIQINNILLRIYTDCSQRLEEIGEAENGIVSSLDIKSGTKIQAKRAGYYQDINSNGLLERINSMQTNIIIYPVKGQYILPTETVMLIDKKLDKEKAEKLLDYMIYSNAKEVRENYALGFKQISEVGVKAMSPGINDPGTAIITIDYLTSLFKLRMKLGDIRIVSSDEGPSQVEHTIVQFADMIYDTYSAYRQYCKHDYILMKKLADSLMHLKDSDAAQHHYYDCIDEQLALIKEDVKEHVSNETDRVRILNRLNGEEVS